MIEFFMIMYFVSSVVAAYFIADLLGKLGKDDDDDDYGGGLAVVV